MQSIVVVVVVVLGVESDGERKPVPGKALLPALEIPPSPSPTPPSTLPPSHSHTRHTRKNTHHNVHISKNILYLTRSC